MSEFMRLQDMLSGHDGNVYITLNGKILPAGMIGKIEAKEKKTVESKRPLGQRVIQHAVRGVEYTLSATLYHITSAFIEAAKAYKDTGVSPEITVQVYNENPVQGRSEILLRNVIFNETLFAKLDDSSDDSLSVDTDGTFDDFDIISKFGGTAT
ncbi:phage tail tube protein [Acetanaerobacterium elongatum]|uniref:Phage tail tube protein n=1 Tax=Acetanaerobacterium elongatum TaxID=258515 RepID=A0A1G9Z2X5_9FIRM|nr:phage tail tube protein [Acetanaerobacterium elongatum]SDN15255.1 Phage tail tube protein [Acetanaerobacterium elongatum]